MSFLSGKKKWIAFIIAVLVNGLNDVLGLHLSAQTIDNTTWISGGYIAVEGALDLIRALSAHFKKPTISSVANTAYTTFKDAIPMLTEVHSYVNQLLDNVKKDDGSQLWIESMAAYSEFKRIIDARKIPDPVQTITEHKEAS